MIAEATLPPVRTVRDDDGPIDCAAVLTLLTEVRPDITLADFVYYCNLPEEVLAPPLAEVQDRGEVAIYQDEWNPPIVCLTPLGAQRAGVRLSYGHPPIWVPEDGSVPPIIALPHEGEVVFTDLEDPGEDGLGDVLPFAERADPRQREAVEVLVDVEELAERLLAARLVDGRLLPTHSDFAPVELGIPWPLDAPARATRQTPSASTWQELYSTCPFCMTLPEDEDCPVCHRQAPGRPCPACRGRNLAFREICLWCGRSGVDYLLPRAEVPVVRRKLADGGALKGGRG